MPLTGKIEADFASFSAAVDGAVIKLRDLESGSEKVTTALTRTAESFSGTKVIQQATLMAEVFDRAGGRAKFTEAELARMGATGAEAAAKMRALGIDVPPGIARIALEAKGADEAHKGLGATVKDLVLSYVALSTARVIVNYAQSIVTEASALKDLAQQTHINVEELQLLAGGMSDFGVNADELGKGLYKLSRGVAGGDESVAHGLALMGIALKDVEGLQGQALFLKIEAGLATLQGGLRDTAAAELFGGKLGAAMAGASEGIEGALQKWQRFNHVMSTDAVDAMDQYDESVKQATTSLNAIAGGVIGRSAQTFNVLTEAVDKGAGRWATFWALTKDASAQILGYGTGTEHMTRLLDEQNKVAEVAAAAQKKLAASHGEVVVALDTRTKAEIFMATLERNAAATLEPLQLANLAHLKEIGALTAQNAAGIGVSAAQFAKYAVDVKAAAENTTLLNAATLGVVAASGTATDILLANAKRVSADMTAKRIEEGTADAAYYALRATLDKQATDAILVDHVATSKGSQEALQQTYLKAKATFDAMLVDGQHHSTEQVRYFMQLKDGAHAALSGIEIDFDALEAHSIEGQLHTARNAQATFDAMLSDGLHHSQAQIQYFREIRDAERDALHETADEHARTFAHMRDDVDRTSFAYRAWLANAATDAERAALGMMKLCHAVDENAKSVHTLAGEWITAADAREKFSAGSTLDVAHAARDPEIAALLHAGWSLENAEAIKFGRQWGFQPKLYSPSGAPETAPDPGERVPGYLTGGPTREGPAYLHADEYVVPKAGALVLQGGGHGQGGAGPNAITVQLHVSGLLLSNSPAGRAEFADFASDAIMQQLLAKGWRPPLGARR